MYTCFGFEMKNGHLRHRTHGALFDAMGNDIQAFVELTLSRI